MIILRLKTFSDELFEQRLFRNKANHAAEHERLLNEERNRIKNKISNLEADIAAQGGKDSFGYLSSLEQQKSAATARLEELNNAVGTGKLSHTSKSGEFKRLVNELETDEKSKIKSAREMHRAGKISKQDYKKIRETITDYTDRQSLAALEKLKDAREAQNMAISKQRKLQRGEALDPYSSRATHVKGVHGGKTRYKLVGEQVGGYQEALNRVMKEQHIDPSLSYNQSVRNEALQAVKEQRMKNLTPEQRKRFEELQKSKKAASQPKAPITSTIESQPKAPQPKASNPTIGSQPKAPQPKTPQTTIKSPPKAPITSTIKSQPKALITSTIESQPKAPQPKASNPTIESQKHVDGFFKKDLGRVKRLYTGKSKYGKVGQGIAIGGTTLVGLGTGYDIYRHQKNKKENNEQ